MLPKKWLYPFHKIGQKHNNLVGKKCANLGEMTKMGLQVPPGFAISLEGFELFIKETGIGDRIQKILDHSGNHLEEQSSEVSEAILEVFEATPIPPKMEKKIHNEYQKLCKLTRVQDVGVAVRSSGAMSMPGQMDTFLNVRGAEAVIRNIRSVWASSFSQRAIVFRMQKGIPVIRAPIGVAVLKMVNARSAGVLLTVIPTSGDRSKVVIDGNWGLGEIVVAGDSTPDTFIVDKATFECDLNVNPKQKRVVFAGQGTALEDVPVDQQNMPCLRAEEVQKLAETGCFVEHYFGEPQDMEWAIDASLPFPDNIFWLQTRPAKWVNKEGAKGYFTDLMGSVFK